MKEYLRSSHYRKNVTELRFSILKETILEKPEWENSHEFSYGGEMYDVIDKKNENGELVILCINDKQESRLIKEYEKINIGAQGAPSSKNKSTVLLKLIGSAFIMIKLPVFPDAIAQTKLLPGYYTGVLSPGAVDVLTPPPQAS